MFREFPSALFQLSINNLEQGVGVRQVEHPIVNLEHQGLFARSYLAGLVASLRPLAPGDAGDVLPVEPGRDDGMEPPAERVR